MVPMHRYILPKGMRYASLDERELFYSQEFDLHCVKEWLRPIETLGHVVFAAIMGRHTRIFRREYAEDATTTILIKNYEDLKDVRKLILDFLPEAVYYDRNIYEGTGRILGQELAFDLDPENLTCPIHGSLEDKMKRQQGLGFCKIELTMVKEETLKLYERLQSLFSELKIVYSGRGFHIHVFDKETFDWKNQRRRALAKKLTSEGFLIDEWVTSGAMRLIRLPYSLHGMVSRIATPISVDKLPEFNPVTDKKCLPEYLHS